MAEISDFDPVDANNTARWPEGMTGSQINNAARADEGILARWYRDWDGSIVSTGSSNAYAITSNRAIGSLVDNIVMAFTPNHTSTNAPTLNLNGLGAKPLTFSNGGAASVNDVISGHPLLVVYKLALDDWVIVNGTGYATEALSGKIELATQAEMEAAADLFRAVRPGTQHFHPGHPKAWAQGDSAGGINGTAYNVASIVRNSTGVYTVTLTTAMSDANYAVLVTAISSVNHIASVTITSSSVFVVRLFGSSGGGAADVDFSLVVMGDQA